MNNLCKLLLLVLPKSEKIAERDKNIRHFYGYMTLIIHVQYFHL